MPVTAPGGVRRGQPKGGRVGEYSHWGRRGVLPRDGEEQVIVLRARWLSLLTGLIRLCGPAVLAALVVQASRWTGVPAGRLPWLRYRLVRSSRAGLAGMCRALSREPDRVDELASTQVPVLIIFGENDDVWSPQVQEEMARRLNAPIAIIKNAGHTPNEDQPEATADAMLRFWDIAEREP
jgi:pimeloyl-ACP methyl ester carboxylesterase